MGALRFVVGLLRFAHDRATVTIGTNRSRISTKPVREHGLRGRGKSFTVHGTRTGASETPTPTGPFSEPETLELRGQRAVKWLGKGGLTLAKSIPLRARTAQTTEADQGATVSSNSSHPTANGEHMSSLDIRLLSVSSGRVSLLRPILTLSVVLALIFVGLAASI